MGISQCTLFLSAVCILTLLMQTAVDAHESKMASDLHNAKTERQRLDVCVDAINQGMIHDGMKVRELDQLLGTTFVKEIPKNDTYQTTADFLLGDEEFSWDLACFFNAKEEVYGYYLTNRIGKGFSLPSLISAKEISRKFRNTKTTSQKLNCVIEAIDSRVIRKQARLNSLFEIFGKCTEQKVVKRDRLVTSFSLGNDKKPWRLVCSSWHDEVFDYYLTNSDVEPWIVNHLD
jgi:hypothetical protein